MQTFISNSEKETKQLAARLAHDITKGVIALSGELGAGKTTFVQGFAKGLGIKDRIISPTFVFIRQHKIPGRTSILYHIDLYRLENLKDFGQFGIEEIWLNLNNIVLIEWAEKIENLLPQNTLSIKIKKGKGNIRSITVG